LQYFNLKQGEAMKGWHKILGIAVIGFVLTGCSHQTAKENKITIWHWMNDRRDAFDTLAQRYKEQTGLEVDFKLFSPPDIYSQKVIAAARADKLPDIFGILGEKKTLASFIKAGYILDLTPYMKEKARVWEKSFYRQALGVVRFKKNNRYAVSTGIYGVPIDITVMEFLYNKTLFEKAGLDPQIPPVEFEQFINYAKKIKETLGVDGFVCGWGEGWLLNALAVEWAINLMGKKKFFRTIEGKIPYTDPQWIEVFSLFAKMKEADILNSNIATMINKESEDSFSRGGAAFSFNGSWAVNVYKQLSPDLEYAFFPLPRISSKFPVEIWGGAGSSFMVNAHSSKKEQAVDFLKWFTAESQQEFLVEETNNLPAIRNCQSKLSAVLKPLVDDLDILTHPNIWPHNEDSRVLEVINRDLQQIIMGVKTPEEAAQEIQKVKERISIND